MSTNFNIPPTSPNRGPQGPRRVRHGIKLKAESASRPRHWLSAAMLALFDRAASIECRETGLEYARAGQIVSFTIDTEGITAKVQGRAPQPHVSRIFLDPLPAEQWDAVIEAMAKEALYAGTMLNGDVPESLNALFSASGRPLIDDDPALLLTHCTCGADHVCRHVVATALVAAQRLDEEPQLWFAVLGMPPERLLERLRQGRSLHTHGVASAHVEPSMAGLADLAIPLEASLDDFWRVGPQLAAVEKAAPPQHVTHALLRRLGPSPIPGKFPLVGLLASIYDTVSAGALHIRDQAERIEPPDASS